MEPQKQTVLFMMMIIHFLFVENLLIGSIEIMTTP